MFATLFVAVDVSDDDVELAEVASQCGYDVIHPKVLDVDEPVVGDWHGQPCLLLKLTLAIDTDVSTLEQVPAVAVIKLSHPSISSNTVLAIG
jgi:hypothetical protein